MDDQLTAIDRLLSRRQLLRGLGAGGALLVGAPLLAACGSSNKSSSATTAAPGTSSGGGSGTTPAATGSVADITKFVTIDTAHSGKGMTLDCGGVLAFTGAGAFFGRTMSAGMKLAQQHIVELGGPDFNLIFKDHKSGDPQAGVTAARELGLAHVPMMLASYGDDILAMAPLQAQYNIMTLDGGGGTGIAGQGKPLFWGARAITPDDTYDGVMKWMTAKMPNAKNVVSIAWDAGAALNATGQADLKAHVESIGAHVGKFILSTIDATDYSTGIEQIKAANPDIVYAGLYGNDLGYFMKQYQVSGINKPVLGFEYTQPAADIAGSAYNGLYLAFDYFNGQTPDNGWSAIFIEEFKKANGGTVPDYYAANYYEDMFVLWALVQRTLAAGGDPKDGASLNSAMVANPVFPSVYGGNATTAGTLAFNLKTHSVSERPMTLIQYENGNKNPQAYFDIGGRDFRLA
jgi:branched-chain amino acid transport system substrate-binding protein